MRISILGCGWLGLPAALHLQSSGHEVRGSATDSGRAEFLKSRGVETFVIRTPDRLDSEESEPFWSADLLFLNIPPGRSRGDVLRRHPEEIAALAVKIKAAGIPWLIFASSTSVYGTYAGEVGEDDAGEGDDLTESGRALIRCENLLRETSGFDTTVIRFGGLYGYDRHPVRNLAKRSRLTQGDKPVNLIHRDDCIGILSGIILQNLRNETFNAVSDQHPSRGEFYRAAAKRAGLTLPAFEPAGNMEKRPYKIVSNRKVRKALNYSFRYPDPRNPAP